MQIEITGKDLDVTDKIKTTVDNKLTVKVGKHLKDFAADMQNGKVGISRPNNYSYKINFDMWLPGKHHIYAEAEDNAMSNAIVKLRKNVVEQIQTFKSQLRDSQQSPHLIDTIEENQL